MAQPTLADAIPNEECYTIEDVAAEFNLGPQRTRQIIEKALKDQIVPKLIKKNGRQNLYTPQMVEALKEAIDKGRLGKFNNRKQNLSLKRAELIIQVPIFDQEIAGLLMKKFVTPDAMSKYLKQLVEETVKPLLIKKREIEEKYEQEMNKFMHSLEA